MVGKSDCVVLRWPHIICHARRCFHGSTNVIYPLSVSDWAPQHQLVAFPIHRRRARIFTIGPIQLWHIYHPHHIPGLGAREVLVTTVHLVQSVQIAGIARVGLRAHVIQAGRNAIRGRERGAFSGSREGGIIVKCASESQSPKKLSAIVLRRQRALKYFPVSCACSPLRKYTR